MAELLICAVDRNCNSRQEYAESFKLLDLIAVQADGWNWTPTELAHPDWRLLKWPELSLEEILEQIRSLPVTWVLGPRGNPWTWRTYFQPCAAYLDWTHPAAPAAVLSHIRAPRMLPHVNVHAPASLLAMIKVKRSVARSEPAEIVAAARDLGKRLEDYKIPLELYAPWFDYISERYGDVVA